MAVVTMVSAKAPYYILLFILLALDTWIFYATYSTNKHANMYSVRTKIYKHTHAPEYDASYYLCIASFH